MARKSQASKKGAVTKPQAPKAAKTKKNKPIVLPTNPEEVERIQAASALMSLAGEARDQPWENPEYVKQAEGSGDISTAEGETADELKIVWQKIAVAAIMESAYQEVELRKKGYRKLADGKWHRSLSIISEAQTQTSQPE